MIGAFNLKRLDSQLRLKAKGVAKVLYDLITVPANQVQTTTTSMKKQYVS